ncbi:uncharacterized protein LOC110809990 [Carica papaya]|uniref:uncharacterized protein LOC110809990 n=1 Tax=Carica papaya TaxID=3649 RepID=UPI000B8CA854|nr:uncharacterized protein LOC110809990 [Carica papaya]
MDSCCRRANRSDIHLPREEEEKLGEQTREYYDRLAPERHTKPQRSEYSPTYVDAFSNHENNSLIPEYAEFQRLENDTQKLVYKGNEVMEEFIETDYYRDLNGIDKQHHTTGTGFIKINSNAKCFSLVPDPSNTCHTSCKGNPATNDWIPATADTVTFTSDKPNRSDN